MTYNLPSKEEGANALHPQIAELRKKPLSMAQRVFLQLGGATDSKGLFICPKIKKGGNPCHKIVKTMSLVKRSGKYGKEYNLIQIKHWNPRNKQKKLSYCYVPIKEQLQEARVE